MGPQESGGSHAPLWPLWAWKAALSVPRVELLTTGAGQERGVVTSHPQTDAGKGGQVKPRREAIVGGRSQVVLCPWEGEADQHILLLLLSAVCSVLSSSLSSGVKGSGGLASNGGTPRESASADAKQMKCPRGWVILCGNVCRSEGRLPLSGCGLFPPLPSLSAILGLGLRKSRIGEIGVVGTVAPKCFTHCCCAHRSSLPLAPLGRSLEWRMPPVR